MGAPRRPGNGEQGVAEVEKLADLKFGHYTGCRGRRLANSKFGNHTGVRETFEGA